MKQKTIRDIIKENDDLHFINITKGDKHDKSTWSFVVDDDTSALAGTSGNLSNYNFKIVTLRKGNHFFLGYKIFNNNTYEYYVDPRKANHRNTVSKYINSLMKYTIYSNDISITKDMSSFRVTDDEMKSKKIDNYIDLCHYFGNYSAIGTGITRNVRNIILMDIDVDCEKEDNAYELNKLLILFGQYNALPDFVIHNHKSKHVQLQWLIQSFQYKIINQDVVDEITKYLEGDKIKDGEINLLGTEFLELSPAGIAYRRYTRALTNIVKKHKFGDKQFTFWKCKNFYTAFLEEQELELRMPYYKDGEIKYLSKEIMKSLFSTKEARKIYYEEAPSIAELYQKTYSFMHDLIEKVSDKKVSKIKDGDETEKHKPIHEHEKTVREKTNDDKTKDSDSDYGLSRNTFVLSYTRDTTWNIAREMNYRKPKDILELDETELNLFRSKIYTIVKEKFKEEDEKYNGCWPETSNHSAYKKDEFDNTFNYSFTYAISQLKSYAFSEQQRNSSVESRHLKKDMHLTIVDYLRTSSKLNRTDLLKNTNDILLSSGQKEISLATLKRCISESKKLSVEDRINLYKGFIEGVDERIDNLKIAKDRNSKKAIDMYSKRLEYISINIIEDIRDFIQNDTAYR